MHASFGKTHKTWLTALSAAIALALSAGSAQAGVSQSGEAKNMHRVGHVDLQGRDSYQPNVIVYPDGRTIAFAGTHNGSAPNPLNTADPTTPEPNGTMIIDVTDPANPKQTAHIPVPVAGGQAQMARMCLGSDLANDPANKNVYLLRNIQGNAAQMSGYEVWDVTDIRQGKPFLASAIRGIRNTHKLWWECNTGIAYMPGSYDVPAATGERWRTGQSMVIVNWQNPTAPPLPCRTFGLPGGQPGAIGPTAPSLHGPISAHEHPNAAGKLARALTADDVIGNRIYAAYGVGDDGVMQILDRKKLLPVSCGGTYTGPANTPSEADLLSAQAGILYMSPDQGGHTSMPVFGMNPPSYQSFTEFKTRDIVLLASEATADRCQEAPHWSFIVDVTVENSKTAPPGTRCSTLPTTPCLTPVEVNQWQGPMVLSTMSVDPRAGEKYPRGNYCTRGARYGVHSSEENFNNPLYGKLTVLAYFTGGVRVWDIREPQAPVEVAFYVTETTNFRDPTGYMTNNVEVDNRGFIYSTDRNGSGMDILQLMGPAKNIAFPPPQGN